MVKNTYLTFNDLDSSKKYDTSTCEGFFEGCYVTTDEDEPVDKYFQFTISCLAAKKNIIIYFDNSIIYFSDNVIEYINDGIIKFDYNPDYHAEGDKWIAIKPEEVLNSKINGNLYDFPFPRTEHEEPIREGYIKITNTKEDDDLSNINITLKNIQFATFEKAFEKYDNVIIPEFYTAYPNDNKEFARNLVKKRTNNINEGIPKYLISYGLDRDEDVSVYKYLGFNLMYQGKDCTYVKLKWSNNNYYSSMSNINDFTNIINVITDWPQYDNIDKFATDCNLFTYDYKAKGIVVILCWKINIVLDMEATITPQIEIIVNGDEGDSYADKSTGNTTYYYYKSYEAISGKTVAQTIRKFIDYTKIKWICQEYDDVKYDGRATATLYVIIKNTNED